MRDITLGITIYPKFTTRAFATGVPTVLAGTPVISVYEDDNLTQITSGVTLGVDHDSVVGFNMITIVATGGNGFENGKEYAAVITTGTVGGVSVVGEKVAEFTIGQSAAAVDLANGTDGLTAIKSDTATILVDTAAMQPQVAKIPLSDGAITWNSTALGSINAEADTALTDYDGPTNAEMEARTLVAASYFDPAADAVANVTLTATTTTLTNKTGFSLSTAGILAIWDQLTSALTTASTIGKLLVDNINATISSRSTFDETSDAVANVTLVATTTAVTNDVGITQAAADKAWSTTSRTLTDGIVKNAIFNNFPFQMVLTSDHVTPATGLTVTGQRSIDAGAYANVAGTIAEISNGTYQIDLTAADTNGDTITYKFSSATADDTFITVLTQ